MKIESISPYLPINQPKNDFKALSKENTPSFKQLLENKKELMKTSLKESCNQFEAIFINSLQKTMRNSSDLLEGEGFFKKSSAEKLFTDMLDEKYSEIYSKKRVLGISDLLYDQLSQNLKLDSSPAAAGSE